MLLLVEGRSITVSQVCTAIKMPTCMLFLLSG